MTLLPHPPDALTVRERACLEFLADKMSATGAQIGEVIQDKSGFARSQMGNARVGNRVARQLGYPRFYVSFLADLNQWRITAAGRDALKVLT